MNVVKNKLKKQSIKCSKRKIIIQFSNFQLLYNNSIIPLYCNKISFNKSPDNLLKTTKDDISIGNIGKEIIDVKFNANIISTNTYNRDLGTLDIINKYTKNELKKVITYKQNHKLI